MAHLMLEILTPDKTLFWGRALGVTVKAVDGEVHILPGHAPYVNILPAGEIRLHTEENTCLHLGHQGGVLDVSRDKSSILVQAEVPSALSP